MMKVNFPEHKVIAHALALNIYCFSNVKLSKVEEAMYRQLEQMFNTLATAHDDTIINVSLTDTICLVSSLMLAKHCLKKHVSKHIRNEYYNAIKEAVDILRQQTGKDPEPLLKKLDKEAHHALGSKRN